MKPLAKFTIPGTWLSGIAEQITAWLMNAWVMFASIWICCHTNWVFFRVLDLLCRSHITSLASYWFKGSAPPPQWKSYPVFHFCPSRLLHRHWDNHTRRTHVVIITSLLRQNDVATSFWFSNDVIIAACVHWDTVVPVLVQQLWKNFANCIARIHIKLTYKQNKTNYNATMGLLPDP